MWYLLTYKIYSLYLKHITLCTSREFKDKEPVEKLARAILEAETLCQVCGHPTGARLLLAVMRSYPASALAMLHWAATHLEAVLADVYMVEAVILVVENVLGKYTSILRGKLNILISV